jgi:hypothetical protein
MSAAHADREPKHDERGGTHELNRRDIPSATPRPEGTARLMRQLHGHIVAQRLPGRYRP